MAEYSALLVCSGGGHLKQLTLLAPRMGINLDRALWVTFDTGLSRSALAGHAVQYAHYAAPRDLRNIWRNQSLAAELLRGHQFGVAVSTGASLAVNFLPKAARLGVPSHYIESAARADGPSLTGRILARVPGVNTYCQYRAWSGARWRYAGSVFDGFAAEGRSRASVSAQPIRRAVVSVGTTESYGFRRLVEGAARALRDVPEVTWQTGPTDISGLNVQGRYSIPSVELNAAIETADVVVTHAGTGIALTCLELGKVPVLVPRARKYGEHVDDHQQEIAGELSRRGLAIVSSPDALDSEVIGLAASRRVTVVETPPPLLIG